MIIILLLHNTNRFSFQNLTKIVSEHCGLEALTNTLKMPNNTTYQYYSREKLLNNSKSDLCPIYYSTRDIALTDFGSELYAVGGGNDVGAFYIRNKKKPSWQQNGWLKTKRNTNTAETSFYLLDAIKKHVD